MQNLQFSCARSKNPCLQQKSVHNRLGIARRVKVILRHGAFAIIAESPLDFSPPALLKSIPSSLSWRMPTTSKQNFGKQPLKSSLKSINRSNLVPTQQSWCIGYMFTQTTKTSERHWSQRLPSAHFPYN